MRYHLCHGARFALAVIVPFALVSAATVSAALTAAAATIRPVAPTALDAATPQSVIDGPACPDVMVIAARGTGESPSDWQIPSAYTGDADKGAGPELYSMYGTLTGENTGLMYSLDPVVYPVDSLATFLEHPGRAEADAQTGANAIVSDIEQTDAVCGHTVRYILAGYSLGAWAMHIALDELSSTQRGEIAGVTLFGDPLFIPFLPFDNDLLEDNFGLAIPFDLFDGFIPAGLVNRTMSWCLPADPICQAFPNDPRAVALEGAACLVAVRTGNTALCAHLQYATGGDTARAATFLAPLLPSASLWPEVIGAPPTGTVGTPYLWAANVAPAGTYAWTSAGTLPPGLLFSTEGVLSGTPTQTGTFTFSITATGSYGRFATSPVTVTINSTSGSGSGSWTATEAPLPADGVSGSLSTVSCISATSCLAAGNYTDSSGDIQGLLLTGSGTSWTPAEAPLPPNAGADPFVELKAVACNSGSSCVAVGSYVDSSIDEFGLLLTGSGTSWTATEAPVPANARLNPGVVLNGVACPTATACVAIGQYIDSSGNEQGLLLTGSGTSWTAVEAPLPANAAVTVQVAELNAVACPTATSCITTGYYTPNSSGSFLGLLLTGSGTSWTAVEAPLPSDASSTPGVGLPAVACASSTSCVATGEYQDSSGDLQGLLLTGSGTSWAATEAPLPSSAPVSHDAYLSAVACASVSECVAAGNYGVGGFGQPFFVTGSGTSWTAPNPPLPADASGQSELYATACPATSSCVIAGEYTDSSGNSQGLLITGAP